MRPALLAGLGAGLLLACGGTLENNGGNGGGQGGMGGGDAAAGGGQAAGAGSGGSGGGQASNGGGAGASNGGGGGVSSGGSGGGAAQAGGGGGGAKPDAGAGGGSDAGKADAGNGGAGGGVGASDAGGTGCAGAWFCDDFESYDAGKAPGGPWKLNGNNGTVDVTTAKFASGGKSVHLQVGAGDSRHARIHLIGAPYLPVPGNNMFGRVRMWITNLPTDDTHHYSLIAETGNSAAAGSGTTVRYGAMHQTGFLANYWQDNTSADCWRNSATKMPQGKWVCMEWQFDGTRNEARLWIDGKAVSDATIVGSGDGCVGKPNQTWNFPVANDVSVGWDNWQAWTGQELWVDDFALGPQRIGCGP